MQREEVFFLICDVLKEARYLKVEINYHFLNKN